MVLFKNLVPSFWLQQKFDKILNPFETCLPSLRIKALVKSFHFDKIMLVLPKLNGCVLFINLLIHTLLKIIMSLNNTRIIVRTWRLGANHVENIIMTEVKQNLQKLEYNAINNIIKVNSTLGGKFCFSNSRLGNKWTLGTNYAYVTFVVQ